VTESLEGSDPAQTAGAYWAFCGLGALALLFVAAFVIVFGFYGETVTAGVDVACAESAYKSGKKFEEQGNLEQAIQRYRQALQGRFPDKARAYECGRSIGDVLLKQGRYSEAVNVYRKLHDEALASAKSMPGYVNALRGNGNYGEAERVGRDWLARARTENDEKQLYWANAMLGRICWEQEKLGDALNYFRDAVAMDEATIENVHIAQILRKQKKLDAALKHLEDVMTKVGSGLVHEEAKRFHVLITKQKEVESRKKT